MGTQQFCLRWNNHQSNMLNVFDQLLRNEAFVDVTLACEGVSVKAHKMVLSACSPYFQNLFLENPCQHPIVILKDMKYSELRAIIDFMYKGEINVSQDQLSALLKTAETLKVKGLAEVSTGNVPNSGVDIPSLDDSGVSPGGSTGPGGSSAGGGSAGGGGGGGSAGSGPLSCASGSGVGVGSGGSGVSMAPGSPTGDGRSSPPAKRKRHRQGRRPSNGDVSDTGERSGDQQFDAEALARLKSEPLEPAAETHVEVVMEPPSQQYDPEVPSSLERCLSEAREREISLIPRSDGITTGSTSGHGNLGQPQPSTSGTSQASQDPKGSRPGRGRYRRGLDATYELALADVATGRLSFRRAAEVYNVPLTTLFGRGKAQGICSVRRRGRKVITDAEILHWAAASIMYDRPGGAANIVGNTASGGGGGGGGGGCSTSGGGRVAGPDVDVDVEDLEDEDDEDEDLERATRRRIMMMMGGDFGSSGTQSGAGPSSQGHGKGGGGVRGHPTARLADDDDDDEDVDVVMEHDALIDKYERALEEVRCSGLSFQQSAARHGLPVLALRDMGKARGVGGPTVQRKKVKAVRRKKKKAYQRQQKQQSASTSETPQNDVPTEQDELVVADSKEDDTDEVTHSDVKQEVPEMSPEDAEFDVSAKQGMESEEIIVSVETETGKEVIPEN